MSQILNRLTALTIAVILVTSGVVQAQKPDHPVLLDFAVRSTVGVSEMSYEHQRWLAELEMYDYEKLATRTSKVAPTFGPQVMLKFKQYTLSADVEFGNYSFSNSGSTSLRSAQLTIGWSPAPSDARVQGRFLIGYRLARISASGMDTLSLTYSVGTVGLGMALGSKRDASLRWGFNAFVPAVILTHLFSWQDLAEHSVGGSGELTFGYKLHHSPIYFDLGYHFWVSDHPIEIRRRDLVNSLLTLRHGLVLRIGYTG